MQNIVVCTKIHTEAVFICMRKYSCFSHTELLSVLELTKLILASEPLYLLFPLLRILFSRSLNHFFLSFRPCSNSPLQKGIAWPSYLKQKLLSHSHHITCATTFMKPIRLGFISLFLVCISQLCIRKLHSDTALAFLFHLCPQKGVWHTVSTQYVFDGHTGGQTDVEDSLNKYLLSTYILCVSQLFQELNIK